MIAWKIIVGLTMLAAFWLLSAFLIIALAVILILSGAYTVVVYLLPMLDPSTTQITEKEDTTP